MLTPPPLLPNFSCNNPPFLIKIKKRAKNVKYLQSLNIMVNLHQNIYIEIFKIIFLSFSAIIMKIDNLYTFMYPVHKI